MIRTAVTNRVAMPPIRWKQPRAEADREWRELAPHSRRVAVYFIKWGLLVGAPAIVAIHLVLPAWTLRIGLAFTGLVAALPALLHLEAWWMNRCGREYAIDGRGLVMRGVPSARYDWNRIEDIRIPPDPDPQGLRRIEFRVRGRPDVKVWAFDPREVDAGALAQAIAAWRTRR